MYSDVVNWYVKAVFPTPDAPSIATLKAWIGLLGSASILTSCVFCDALLYKYVNFC